MTWRGIVAFVRRCATALTFNGDFYPTMRTQRERRRRNADRG